MSEQLAMFPLSTVLFPGMSLPLHVFEQRYRAMVRDCLGARGVFGVVLIERGSEVGGGDTRFGVGTAARIEQARSLPDGRWVLLAEGTRRIRVSEWLEDEPYPRALVDWVPDPPPSARSSRLLRRAERAVRRARGLLSEMGEAQGVLPSPLRAGDGDLSASSWLLCANAPLTALDRQRLIECDELDRRLALLEELADQVGDDLERILADG